MTGEAQTILSELVQSLAKEGIPVELLVKTFFTLYFGRPGSAALTFGSFSRWIVVTHGSSMTTRDLSTSEALVASRIMAASVTRYDNTNVSLTQRLL